MIQSSYGKLQYNIDPKVAGLPSSLLRNGGERLMMICRIHGGMSQQIELISKMGNMEDVVRHIFSKQMVNKLSSSNPHRNRHAMPYIGWGITPFCEDAVKTYYFDWRPHLKHVDYEKQETTPPLALPHMIILHHLGFNSETVMVDSHWLSLRNGLKSYWEIMTVGCQPLAHDTIAHYIAEWPYLVKALAMIAPEAQQFYQLTDESKEDLLELYWAITRLLDLSIVDSFTGACICSLLGCSPGVAKQIRDFAIGHMSMPSDMFRMTLPTTWGDEDNSLHDLMQSYSDAATRPNSSCVQIDAVMAHLSLLIDSIADQISAAELERQLTSDEPIENYLKVCPLNATISQRSSMAEKKINLLNEKKGSTDTDGDAEVTTHIGRSAWVDTVLLDVLNDDDRQTARENSFRETTKTALFCHVVAWKIALNLDDELFGCIKEGLDAIPDLPGKSLFRLDIDLNRHFIAYQQTISQQSVLSDSKFEQVMVYCNEIWQRIGSVVAQGDTGQERVEIMESVGKLHALFMEITDEVLREEFTVSLVNFETAMQDESPTTWITLIAELMSQWRDAMAADQALIANRDALVQKHLCALNEVIASARKAHEDAVQNDKSTHEGDALDPLLMIADLQNEKNQLSEQVARVTSRNEELTQLIRDKQDELSKLRSKHNKLNSRTHQHKGLSIAPPPSTLNLYETNNMGLVAKGIIAVMSGGDDIVSIMRATESFCAGKLRFTPSAFDAASNYNRQEYSAEDLMASLLRLTFHYAPIFQSKGDTQARQVFGLNEYAAGESDKVLNNERLRKMRTWDVDGVQTLVVKHLSINAFLRVYFTIDDNGIVIVTYVGKHMECGRSS